MVNILPNQVDDQILNNNSVTHRAFKKPFGIKPYFQFTGNQLEAVLDLLGIGGKSAFNQIIGRPKRGEQGGS